MQAMQYEMDRQGFRLSLNPNAATSPAWGAPVRRRTDSLLSWSFPIRLVICCSFPVGPA
jgi:hypothetical protein